MATEQQVDEAAERLARRLDVILFLNELDESEPQVNRLHLLGQILRRWGIDVSRLLDAEKYKEVGR